MKFIKLSLGVSISLLLLGIVQAQHCDLPLFGHVYESETGASLPYATIRILEINRGAITDESGYYILPNLCEDSVYTISVSHVECEHEQLVLRLEEGKAVDFRLKHHILSEVLVIERAIASQPTQASAVVTGAELEAGRTGGLGEALKRLPGVTTLNTGSTIAKPVIQGLHSNRIAVVSNQVLLEGQQWGSEHAPEVDPFTAASIQVIKGAAGVRYGPGAIGGAVVLEPPALRDSAGWGGWAAASAWSNGYGGLLAAALDGKINRLALRVQLTAKRNGNLSTPKYWLGNTGVGELDGSLMAGWNSSRWRHEFSATAFHQRIGILRAAHIGNTTDLKRAIESTRPLNNRDEFSYAIGRPYQLIQHYVGRYKFSFDVNENWIFKTQFSSQFNHRREFDAHAPLSDPDDSERKPQLRFRIWTNYLDASLEHRPLRHWQGAVGMQLLEQENLVGKGGLIPNFRTLGGALWAMERWRRYPHRWEYEVGIRYDYRQSQVNNDETFRQIDTLIRFGNVSASGGIILHTSRFASFTLNSAFAWRPPHVNELFARGVHHGAATYEQGRSDLATEKAWNSNLTFQWQQNGALFSATVFVNRLQDFIYLDPQQEPVLTIRGAFPAYFYEQDDALIRGFDANMVLPFARQWALEGRVSVLRAQRFPGGETERDWLPLMPGDRFQYGITWSPNIRSVRSTFVQFMATTVLQQTRIPKAGLVKAAPPTYTLLEMQAGHKMRWAGKPLEIGLSAQNLTNLVYREYLNFFRLFTDEPGLNISLRLKLIF